jgi:pimeloyl-ACP methyl ester carboxylesterase
MRLWTKPAHEPRNPLPITEGGDYIPPDVTLDMLFMFGERSIRTAYIEMVNGNGLTPIHIEWSSYPWVTYQTIYFRDTVLVTLIPVEVIPNFDRNETIDLTGTKDRGKVTEDKPYPLWINDDNDSGDLGGDDVPGGGSNATNNVVDGSRDLVDFAPLFLDIKTMLDVLPPDTCTYKLKQEDGAVNFVYTDLTPDHVKDYLTINTENQTETYGPSFNQKPNVATTTQITSAGVTLNTTFLNKIKNDGKGVILVEGRSASTNPLIVEVYKGTDKLGEFSFPMKITTVDKMFRHKNLRPDNEGWGTAMGEPENFPDTNTVNKYFLFLHGYNVSSTSAKGWHAETFKRLYWAGSRARFVGVTWFGNQGQTLGVTPNYHVNVINAQLAAAGLASTVNGLSGEVHAAGHSLGNMVVSTAISDYGANISDYYMLNAAVATESYDGSVQTTSMWHNEWADNPGDDPTHAAYDTRLLCSNWHDRFDASDHRGKLTWRDRLSNTGSTHYYNFYSSSENVLGNHTGNAPAVGEVLFTEIVTGLGAAMSGQSSDTQGEFAWAYQEKLKGLSSRKILGSSYGGWAFNWVDWGIPLNPQETIFRERYPGETGTILSDVTQLKTKPFFFKGINEADQVFTTNGSAYAQTNRNKLLAEMVPALSNSAGANNVQKFTNDAGETRNFNMPGLYKNGWPSSRSQEQRWLHSDLKTIGYPYIYPMYDEIVELGELDK